MNMHFLETQDWAWDELDQMLQHASELKDTPLQPLLEGKSIALLFFNPSCAPEHRLNSGRGNWRESHCAGTRQERLGHGL